MRMERPQTLSGSELQAPEGQVERLSHTAVNGSAESGNELAGGTDSGRQVVANSSAKPYNLGRHDVGTTERERVETVSIQCEIL
jgi:hypothetical protein